MNLNMFLASCPTKEEEEFLLKNSNFAVKILLE